MTAPSQRSAARARAERAAWTVLLVVVVLSLGYAAVRDTGPRSEDDRINAIAETIRCPTCQGESVADSNAVASREIRRDIARRVREGETDTDIRAAYVERYGEDIVLTPSSEGITALVWILPVVVGGAAIAGLVVVFLRWRGAKPLAPTDVDRELVERALDGRREP